MNQLILSIFITLIPFWVFAQQKSLPKGCYMNLKEVNNKQPSGYCSLKLLERGKTGDKFPVFITNDYMFTSPFMKKKVIKKKIFAVVKDGEIYVNCFRLKLLEGYAKVIDKGKYWIFEGSLSNKEIGTISALTGLLGGLSANKRRVLYLFDVNTSELLKAIPKNMKKILKDEELYQKYKSSKTKRENSTILEFLKVINQK